MLKAIEVGSISNNYVNENNINLLYLNNLNKINIFIGENNSGKSRLMRSLVSSNETKALGDIINENYKSQFDRAKRDLLNYINRFNSISPNGQNHTIDIPEDIKKLDDPNFYCETYYLIKGYNYDSTMFTNDKRSLFNSINSSLNELYELLAKRSTNGYSSVKVNELKVCYIPILRGVENFDIYFDLKKSDNLKGISMNESQRDALEEYKLNAKNIYSNKISKAYGINKNMIFTAENLFDDVKNKLLGEEKGRKFIRDFENFISNEFYDGKGFTIIPQIKNGYLNVKIGDSNERALHNLGDGIKQLITILYCMYDKRGQDAIFFIEEPELNLHPGYQRHFIEILQNYKEFKNHQIFITTHSNHMIDNSMTYDNISIYKFINNNNSEFKVLNTTNKDIEILELLGVYNSSVFMSNCTIWVEGISDKILISKYLKVFFEDKNELEYKEDIHYSFVEYGGNNITHWSFISDEDISTINTSGITNKSMIVLDNDNDRKTTRKKKLKEIFGEDNYCELTVREIENTISRKVLEKTLFNDNEPNIRIQYGDNEYATKKEYMGSFIDKHYILSKKYAAKNGTGTIKNKLEFAMKASDKIHSIDDLSPQAIKICEKIYAFIKKSNYKK